MAATTQQYQDMSKYLVRNFRNINQSQLQFFTQKAKQEISVQSVLKEVKLHNDIKSNLENIQVAKVRGIYFNQLSERDNFTLQFTLVIFTDKRRPIEIRRNHLGRR